MPLFNFKIEIHKEAGHTKAILFKRMFYCIWVQMDEQWQLTIEDYAIIENWMDRYNIKHEQVKQTGAVING